MDVRLLADLADARFPLSPRPVPTLSQLIEACEDFEALTKEHSLAGDEWVASSFHKRLFGRGSTPDEAVARLWLAENGHTPKVVYTHRKQNPYLATSTDGKTEAFGKTKEEALENLENAVGDRKRTNT